MLCCNLNAMQGQTGLYRLRPLDEKICTGLDLSKITQNVILLT